MLDGSTRVLAGQAGLMIPVNDPVILISGEVGEGAGLRIIQAPTGGWLRMTTDGDRLWVEEGN